MASSWQETGPGRFERPLDSMELFFQTLAAGGAPLNREHWAISIAGKFQLRKPPGEIELHENLLQAWKTIRYDHPEIASFVTEGTKVYQVADEARLEQWLAETFIIEPITASTKSLMASFKPSVFATCHYLPQSSEVLIHSSHWRMDGIGAINLLGNFFQALAVPRMVVFGDEGKNLTPSLDELAGFENSVSQEAEEGSTDLLLKYFGNLPALGLPTKENLIPGATQRSELVLGPKTTAAIVSRCKSYGLTVTSAMHAASIVATIALDHSESIADRYTSFGAINYRPYLPAQESNPKRHPVSVNMIGLPINLTTSTFAEMATKLNEFYHQPLSLQETNFRFVMAPYIKKFTAIATTPPPADNPAPSEATFNSVGVVDDHLHNLYGDNIEITHFWLGVEMLTRQLNFYVWTWQGKLVLSGCYNSNFFTDGFTQIFLKKCIDILHKELGIHVGEDWSL